MQTLASSEAAIWARIIDPEKNGLSPAAARAILELNFSAKEKHTFYEPVTSWEDEAFDPKDIKLLGSDGKPLDKKTLPEILKNERPVLYTYGEGGIDSTFLKVIKEGTPILVLPFRGPS